MIMSSCSSHNVSCVLYTLQLTDHAMTEDWRRSIQEKTCGQSSNKLWKEERLLHLQASYFGRVCMATDRTNFPNLAASFTLFKNILFSDPIKHGRKYE